jgi:hypothetical protein
MSVDKARAGSSVERALRAGLRVVARWTLGALFAAGVIASSDQADATPEPALSARLDCRASERLVACVVGLKVPEPSYVSYSDARIVSVPSFTEPILRRAEYIRRPSTRPMLKLALVPNGAGSGKVVVKVNAIICKDKPYCPTVTRLLSADISVPR